MEKHTLNRRGFSLVEALISLIVTTVLIGGATALFVQNQRVSAAQMALGTLHANLRFATNQITTDVRGLGMLVNQNLNIAGGLKAFRLISCNNSGTMTTPGPGNGSNFTTTYFPSYSSDLSDAIQLTQVEILPNVYLVDQPSQPSSDLKIRKTDLVKEGDILLITDTNLTAGGTYDVFKATNVQENSNDNSFLNVVHNSGSSGSDWNAPGGLSKVYPAGSQILKFHCWLYYIQTADQSGVGFPRLMRRDLNGTTEVMADYVEDIQVALGIDTSGNNNIEAAEWKTTNLGAISDDDMTRLRAVRLTLTGRTPLVSTQMAGRNSGTTDSRYYRQGVEDRPTGDASTVPYFREAYQRIAMIRNLRPLPTN